MAVPGCVFHRTLTRTSPNKQACVCRETVCVVDHQRYSRDQGSAVYFPQNVLNGGDLYDVTLSDGDCLLRVTLDPALNRLVERNILRRGSLLRNVSFTAAMTAQLPACNGASYRLQSVEVKGHSLDSDWDGLPWFGSAQTDGPLLPLRASRSVFLPLWNNVDFSGDEWRERERDEEEEEEDLRPTVTVSELRDSFLSGRRGVAGGVVKRQLIVRIINVSHLMYYGKTERNCDCPYKALVEVCDRTGSVCVVLWNSVCVRWYRCLKPGDIISLRRYRVKQRYQTEPDDIEISVNSRNPAARISVLQESSVSPEYLPPAAGYNFYTSKELMDRPHGDVCDVIGMVTFSGRRERIRSKDGRGEELLEYLWLRLEDGSSDQPITVKLFSTSQPESHNKLHPLSVVVCTRLKLMKDLTDSTFYLTNTTYTQVYCTGSGHHSEMSYRKLRPVKRFLQWLRTQDDRQVLSRAVIGGFFMFPPPPVSLETFMIDRRGEPGFLRGVELQTELERLCYRERRSFCIQAAVTMVTYSRRGEEDSCLFWTDRSPSLPSTPASFRPSLSSTPSPLEHRTRCKRKLLQAETPRKRSPRATLQPEHINKTVVLFEASMEFLENSSSVSDDDDDDDADDSSFVTAPPPPDIIPVAMETLPMRYDHAHREQQAVAVGMEGSNNNNNDKNNNGGERRFDYVVEDYYTLRLRALSDGVTVDAIFLPHYNQSGDTHTHSNTWTSILTHGAFSTHTPAPAPGDLIAMATQLANQRLVCVIEACHLGGATTELMLSRAFTLND